MRIAVAGAGAFGEKHLDGLRNIDGVEVTSLVGRRLEPTREVAARYGIGHVTTDLADTLARDDVDAVILCRPTQMHAAQGCSAWKRASIQVEIPLADSLADAEARVARRDRAHAGRCAAAARHRPHRPLLPASHRPGGTD